MILAMKVRQSNGHNFVEAKRKMVMEVKKSIISTTPIFYNH